MTKEKLPLHKASACGRVETARMLLENGANVNVRNATFVTPLFIVTSAGDLSIAEWTTALISTCVE